MARNIRIQSAGAYDHVMARGNRTAATQGATPGPVRTTGYPATNALNQYEAITNPRVLEVSGTMAEGFTPGVKVNGVTLASVNKLHTDPVFPDPVSPGSIRGGQEHDGGSRNVAAD